MGAVECRAFNNNELVDNLMMSKYIKTKQVERVFRTVDRGDYVMKAFKENVYSDVAWKGGGLHLSAPSVYSQVMEGLSLEPGQSFLNLGSGTGYLSTMAGLILSYHGTNHGIELHEGCIRHAYRRLEEFKKNSLALEEFDFCEPLFVQGNCLNVAPGRQYDRVYCGAACPESHEAFIKQFVRVGGILVMPFKDELLRIQKTSEHTWLQEKLLPVSFEPLVVPAPSEHTLFHLPERSPLSLQELCRGKIRHRLKQNVWHEHGNLEIQKPITLPYSSSESSSDQSPDHINNAEDFDTLARDPYSRITETSCDPEQEKDTPVPKRDIESTDADTIIDDGGLSSEDFISSSNANSQVSSVLTGGLASVRDEPSCHTMRNSLNLNSRDEVILVHHVKNYAFSMYMKEKINELPLPHSLKKYISYNRM